MKSDTLRLMARAFAEEVMRLHKFDWTRRESAQADLRRLLAKYGYLPNLSEDAIQLVLEQAELATSLED